jgi:hypothetical protein
MGRFGMEMQVENGAVFVLHAILTETAYVKHRETDSNVVASMGGGSRSTLNSRKQCCVQSAHITNWHMNEVL